MATIQPFHALRYNPKTVPDLSSVTAPPYDVISETQRQALASRDPHNVVRLILPQDEPGRDRYTRAAEDLAAWVRDGVLARDPKPGIYVIRQGFEMNGRRFDRTGFIAAVRLEEFGKGDIYPHEETLSAPKEDRLKLMKATRANLSQVFSIFPDDTGEAERWLAEATARQADAESTDNAGVVTLMWCEFDQRRIETLARLMASRKLYIADGHHRYETALNLHRWLREHPEEAGASLEASASIMMLCVAMSDKGLATLPTHRLLPADVIVSIQSLLEKLTSRFDVLPIAAFSHGKGEFDRVLASDASPNVMGLYVGSSLPTMRVVLRDRNALLAAMPPRSEAWRGLDVSILQVEVLEGMLGLTLKDVTRKQRIGYTHDADEAMELVDAGNYAAAFILRPTPVQAVAAVARNLEKMPPKSTFFYPKALTGLVIRQL